MDTEDPVAKAATLLGIQAACYYNAQLEKGVASMDRELSPEQNAEIENYWNTQARLEIEKTYGT